MKLAVITALAIAMIAGPAMAGIMVAPAGYTSYDTTVAIPDGGSLTGIDYYGDKFVLFDGNDIVIANRNGDTESTVYSYSTNVYGSFVEVVGDNVYFGENAAGTLGVASLDGSGGSLVGSLAYNYDFAVNPLGQAFVVTGSSWSEANPVTKIWQFDVTTGSSDLIASISGPSGPIAFDNDGSLYYGSVSPVFGETGGQSIYKWTAAAVAGAVGDSSLTTADASVVVSDVDSPSAFAFDGGGNLFFTSSVASPGSIWKVTGSSVSKFASLDPSLGTSWLTGLSCNRTTGALSAIGGWFAPDWSTVTRIGTIEPAVPEPSSLMMLGSLVGLAFAVRRNRRS